MAIGPVQLVVLGFDRPDLRGGILAELERLRATGTVRVIDALAVYKKEAGNIAVERLDGVTADEDVEPGFMVGAFLGLDLGSDRYGDGVTAHEPLLDDVDAWDVLDEIPPDSAAALVLLEHQWAIPLRDAVVRAGGFRIADGFISPSDLVGFGLHTVDEAERFETLERFGTTAAR